MNSRSSPDSSTAASRGFFEPRIIANLVFYQIVWLACIFGAASERPNWGILTALAAILWHLSQAQRPLDELRLLVLIGVVGGAFDSLLVIFGLIHYPSGTLVDWIAPLWIIALWMAFATTFNLCLRWLHGRPWLASAFGLVGGPLAWWAGYRLGALQLVSQIPALVALGIGWAVLMPVLMNWAARFDGVSRRI